MVRRSTLLHFKHFPEKLCSSGKHIRRCTSLATRLPALSQAGGQAKS